MHKRNHSVQIMAPNLYHFFGVCLAEILLCIWHRWWTTHGRVVEVHFYSTGCIAPFGNPPSWNDLVAMDTCPCQKGLKCVPDPKGVIIVPQGRAGKCGKSHVTWPMFAFALALQTPVTCISWWRKHHSIPETKPKRWIRNSTERPSSSSKPNVCPI